MTADKKTKMYLYAIIAILACVVFLQNCNGQDKTTTKQKVLVPEVKGEFKRPTVIENHFKKDSIVYRKGQVVYTENPINKELAEEFKKAQKENDSLKAFKLYVDSIQEKEQTYTFDDDIVKIDVDTKVRGTVLSIKPKYTIKERVVEVDVKQKEQVFALYGGLGVSNNKEFDNLNIQAEIGIQLKKGDIISITADSRENYGIKYTKQIFKIKK